MNAFRHAVDQQGWTFSSNEQGTDYGIDGDVEVFDGDNTTGLTFRVQVRGRDAKTDRPSRTVKTKHLNYWTALGTPVLLVHHIVESNSTYVKWIHRYDRGPTKPKQKTTTVNFSHEDLLERRISDLPQEIIRWRNADRDIYSRPITVRVSGEPENTETDLFFGLQASIDSLSLKDLIRPTLHDDDKDAFRIALGPTRLRVSLPLEAGSVNAYWKPGAGAGDEHFMVADAINALGLLLARLGSLDDARRLFMASPMASVIPYELESSMVIAGVSESTNSPSTVMPFLIGALYSDSPQFLRAAEIYMLSLTARASALSEFEISHVGNALQHQIDHLRAVNPASKAAARMSQNAAVLMRKAGKWDQAAKFAVEAIEVPSGGYEQRSDIRELLGSCSWHLKQYAEAERWYREALGLGAASDALIANIVDTMTWQGRYRDALDFFDASVTDIDALKPRATAMYLTLSAIVNDLEVELQARSPTDAVGKPALKPPGEESAHLALRQVDALDPHSWAILDERCDTLNLLTARALLTGNPALWMVPVVVAIHSNDENLASKLLVAALELAPGFAAVFAALVDDPNGPWHDEEQRQQVRRALRRHEAKLPAEPGINFVGVDNQFLF